MTADCLLRAFLNSGQEQAVTSPQASTGRRVLLAVKGDKPYVPKEVRLRALLLDEYWTNKLSAFQASQQGSIAQ
jgi:hypothetical protein